MTQHELIKKIKQTGRTVTFVMNILRVSRSTWYYWARTNTFPDGVREKVLELIGKGEVNGRTRKDT